MIKKCLFIGLLVVGLCIFGTSAYAVPVLDSPYVISTNENNELSKEIPTNLVNLKYVGENILEDRLLNGQPVSNSNRIVVQKNDALVIKNMGTYKNETIDLSITFLIGASVTFSSNGTITTAGMNLSGRIVDCINMRVYKHNTTMIYPNVYIGYSEILTGSHEVYRYGKGTDFGLDNLYGIYVPKKLGSLLKNTDVVLDDGKLRFLHPRGNVTSESVYPIFENTKNGFIRGFYWPSGGNVSGGLQLFDPTEIIPPITVPYEGVVVSANEEETIDINVLSPKYTVTQKLTNYDNLWQYPTDQTFKIKTNFERTDLDDFPVDLVVKLANNKIIDKKYYHSVVVRNSLELTFTTGFLKDYKGSIIQIEYSQKLDGNKINLWKYFNAGEKAFVFPYSSENSWERQGTAFKQELLSTGQSKVKFGVELHGTIPYRKEVIQNKSTDDYSPLDFISDLTSNISNDTVTASFTKKVTFENRGEQELFITLESSLSSVTKDIVLKIIVLEGSLHFTDVPSGISFPIVKLTGKVQDYEVSSFNQGILAVLDERLTKSPWSLTATLTENKTDNDFGDILYFRNEEGQVYNITNQSQNIITNKNLDSARTIIDYEKNKSIGLFLRINPLFVKKGGYDGIITWSLVDAPS